MTDGRLAFVQPFPREDEDERGGRNRDDVDVEVEFVVPEQRLRPPADEHRVQEREIHPGDEHEKSDGPL